MEEALGRMSFENVRLRVTERVPPTRPSAAPEKPARASVWWAQIVQSSKRAEPGDMRVSAGSEFPERCDMSSEVIPLSVLGRA